MIPIATEIKHPPKMNNNYVYLKIMSSSSVFKSYIVFTN